ncbi:hypothetical protein LEP1GSC170_0762 [Leptospira interrogans serovar Bataviae str. HAI135]|nr:hypothetical protein LEP1GSC170_0762 [Leptospira interrogans serovar Bataviae str. HAI135]
MRFLVYSISILFLIECGSGILPFAPFNKKHSNNNELLLLLLIPQNSYIWNLPPGFPTPVVPASNPMTQEKVDLGRFYFMIVNFRAIRLNPALLVINNLLLLRTV